MVTLHHLNNSRSQRILWLLEELSIPYEIVEHQRDPKTSLAPASLYKIDSLGRAPVITDGELVLAESGAITEYLIETYAAEHFAKPTEKGARLQYLFWLHFAEGSLMPPLVASLVLEKAREKAGALFFIRPIVNKIVDGVLDAYYRPNLKRSLDFIEAHLRENEWFAGSAPSGADVQMIFGLETLVAREKVQGYNAIKNYVSRVHARDAYQRALAKGGDYAYA